MASIHVLGLIFLNLVNLVSFCGVDVHVDVAQCTNRAAKCPSVIGSHWTVFTLCLLWIMMCFMDCCDWPLSQPYRLLLFICRFCSDCLLTHYTHLRDKEQGLSALSDLANPLLMLSFWCELFVCFIHICDWAISKCLNHFYYTSVNYTLT